MQEMTGRLNATELAKYVEPTKSTAVNDQAVDVHRKELFRTTEDRVHVVPAQSDYLFVCPLLAHPRLYARRKSKRQE